MRTGRESIVKAAIRVFAENGFAGASTREICRLAGVTKPVLYYHFRGKEHLYQELMVDCFGRYQKLLLGALKARGALRDRLVRMVYADFSLTKEDPVRTKFVLRMIFSPGAQHPLFDYIAEMEKERRWITAVLQEGIDDGALRGNAQELATNLMGMQVIATLEFVMTGRPILTRRRAAQCVDMLLQGCTARQIDLPIGIL